MTNILSVQNYILMLELIILLIADKNKVLIYFLLVMFSVIVLFFI